VTNILIVDDSTVFRGLTRKIIESSFNVQKVNTASNGQKALDLLEKDFYDLVFLDVEMPVLDGIKTAPLITEKYPKTKIVILSAMTIEEASKSIPAISHGGIDFVRKPSGANLTENQDSLRKQIIEKVQTLTGENLLSDEKVSTNLSLRDLPNNFLGAKALCIGCSTGGPTALIKLLSQMHKPISIPIFIVQHIPVNFAETLAKRISETIKTPTLVAQDNQEVVAGNIYIAPGDFHMEVVKKEKKLFISLNQNPPENFCRPAVDVLFRSLANIYPNSLLSIILTGMGEDGKKGAEVIVENGGILLAQDEESSTVWGMPGAVAKAGLCHFIGNIDNIEREARKYIRGN